MGTGRNPSDMEWGAVKIILYKKPHPKDQPLTRS